MGTAYEVSERNRIETMDSPFPVVHVQHGEQQLGPRRCSDGSSVVVQRRPRPNHEWLLRVDAQDSHHDVVQRRPKHRRDSLSVSDVESSASGTLERGGQLTVPILDLPLRLDAERSRGTSTSRSSTPPESEYLSQTWR